MKRPSMFISIIIFLCFTFLFFIISQYRAPFSISVSGYTKTDGIKVTSYSRRAPGSATSFDDFLINVQLVSTIGMGIGIFLFVISVSKKIKNRKIRNILLTGTNLNIIQKALDNKIPLTFIYTKENGQSEQRFVQPWQIQNIRLFNCKYCHNYLIAYDLKRRAERFFRVDRITEIEKYYL